MCILNLVVVLVVIILVVNYNNKKDKNVKYGSYITTTKVVKDSSNWNKRLKQLTTSTYELKACRTILFKESSYNPKAVNGSHYGLPQGRSTYLKTANPQEQIEWFMRYVRSRYGTCHSALAFHVSNGYY